MIYLFLVKVSVIGTGYVGLVTAACFSYLGHEISCLDINEERIEKLKKGEVPIYEPGLAEILDESKANNNYPVFTTDAKEAISHGELIFIAVGTPSRENGSADLSYVENAAETIGKYMQDGAVVINKSTVPVGSGNWVQMLVERGAQGRGVSFTVASNPEFLREGTAIQDTLYPDRIVIGSDNELTADKLKHLYKILKEQSFKDPIFCKRPEGFSEVPIISTDITSAEMIKYSANCFLAMKISFANQIANICDLVGAEVKEVMRGIGTDSRIGSKFLGAGIGWGGSCFGKDVKALINIANEYGYDPELLNATKNVNYMQRDLIIKRLQQELKIIKGRKIGLLGLAFKPNTDDLRDSPALDIASALINLGARVFVTDPIAMDNCKKQYPGLQVDYVENPADMMDDLDALVLVTEWDEYKNLPMAEYIERMRGNLFVDGRNQYDPNKMAKHGFNYVGMGQQAKPGLVVELEREFVAA